MSDSNDNDIRQLLETAGPRASPPPEMRERVHAEALKTWQALEPRRSRLKPTLAVAASLLAAVFAAVAWWSLPTVEPVGTVTHYDGLFRIDQEHGKRSSLLPGSRVTTERDSHVTIRLAGNVEILADEETTMTMLSANEVALAEGRVYVDASRGSAVRVLTNQATVTDIGTLFQVALVRDELTVAVREGEVEIGLPDPLRATAADGFGELVRISNARTLERRSVAMDDAIWAWVQESRPPHQLAGSTVYDYLRWVAADSGLELRFASQVVGQQVRQDTFPFRRPTFSSDIGLAEALETTRYRRVASARHVLMIDFSN